MSLSSSDNASSVCSSPSSSYSGGPPRGNFGGETAQDLELACPSITGNEDLSHTSGFRRVPSELQLDSSQTVRENTAKTRKAEEEYRMKAVFYGAPVASGADEAVSVVMINGELYRYPDGKRIVSNDIEENSDKPQPTCAGASARSVAE